MDRQAFKLIYATVSEPEEQKEEEVDLPLDKVNLHNMLD
jgi:hypothetical protein